jgi:hypothetical protein
MSRRFLGDSIDIHAGGVDLTFPHHENEIAQSEAFCGCTYCNVWVHNGFVNIDNEKMSKSLGNFRTLREACKQALDVRAFRSPLPQKPSPLAPRPSPLAPRPSPRASRRSARARRQCALAALVT